MKFFFTSLAIALLPLLCLSQKPKAPFRIDTYLDTCKLQRIKLRATQYHVLALTSRGDVPFVSKKGVPLGVYTDSCSFCEAVLAGTAFVRKDDGEVVKINYAGRGNENRVDCRSCERFARSRLKVESWGRATWQLTSGWGKGVNNYWLVPFRSIAVDSSVVPYGTVIYIPLARGKEIVLPDGSKTTHDGYFFAADKGGVVKGKLIDIFTGLSEAKSFKDFARGNRQNPFTAYIVTDSSIVNTLEKEHAAQHRTHQ